MAKKAKTEKFHSEAEPAVYALLNSVMEKHHKHFRDSEFLILFKHGGWMSRGRTAFARFKVLADDMRRTLDKDAVLYINCDVWRKMTEPQQRYFLDEAFLGLDFKTNAKGDTLEHPGDGRVLLKLVPPDLEAFVEAIKRHGPIAEDVKRLLKGLKDLGQMTIEDVKEEPPAPPHEGVMVTIGEGGVVEHVEDDKNQLTLEEAANDPMHGIGAKPGGDPAEPKSENDDDDLV
ncbi:putative metallopeptidase [Bacillus sp. FJAT-26390]|uniref:putative metallopeptidase n=1 Tax=Bacillus sp. FJAT-26390 TaxID=1743142 RepID=UPI000807D220|nr:putative metallopeptidase [Bacillus sp. FJAT-26390]OBZ15142.1 hypothetical protein A7975_32555 [Bacillus sp. FJAT-26390]